MFRNSNQTDPCKRSSPGRENHAEVVLSKTYSRKRGWNTLHHVDLVGLHMETWHDPCFSEFYSGCSAGDREAVGSPCSG